MVRAVELSNHVDVCHAKSKDGGNSISGARTTGLGVRPCSLTTIAVLLFVVHNVTLQYCTRTAVFVRVLYCTVPGTRVYRVLCILYTVCPAAGNVSAIIVRRYFTQRLRVLF